MISYVLLMRNANTAERYWNQTVGDPPPMQGDRVRGERGSGPGLVYVSQTERELAVGAVLSNGGGQFNGLEGRQGQSAHMDGNMPAGGNILFLDGHVTWRPWAEKSTASGDASGKNTYRDCGRFPGLRVFVPGR